MFIEKDYLELWMQRIMERFNQLESKIEKSEKPVQTINGEKLLDNQDLCILLNVCKRTLQYYRSLGWLPYRKIDQKCYYSESDVQTFLKNHMKNIKRKPENENS